MAFRTARPLPWHPYIAHLRLGFNLLLSPIYLWGAFLAGGELIELRLWLGYLSLHLFLYGGTTAFNSYYDRDVGPIGGMLRPPPVQPGLLPFSLLVQAMGLVPAVLLGPAFVAAWLLLFCIFTAYSHPSVRLKSSPLAALGAIALGQGGIGFALGWLAAGAQPAALLGAWGLLGMSSTSLVVTGLYLVSQSYQAGEDASRGDLTVAVLLGPSRTILAALAPLALGGALVVAASAVLLGGSWSLSLALFFALLAIWLAAWGACFEEGQVERNFRVAMAFMRTASAGLSLFLLLQL